MLTIRPNATVYGSKSKTPRARFGPLALVARTGRLTLTVLLFVTLFGARAHAQDLDGPQLSPVPESSPAEVQSRPALPPAPAAEFQPPPPAADFQSQPAPAAQYQPLPPPAPAPMTAPGSIVPPSPALPTAPGIAYVPEGYWIASSHHCRQSEPHSCSCGDLEFFYRACDGPTQQLNRDAFHASLPPGTPVCIVVHGSFTNWKGLCDDCGPVYRWIRSAAPSRTVNVVFYTWPSAGPITYEPHIDVAILGMRASFNSVYLGDLVARIPSGHPVCIMGHSHGARMAAAALHLLGGGEVDGTHLTYLPPPDQRIRGVLVAGALDHHWLDPGQRFGLALCRVESLLYMRNDHDMVLNIYPMRRFFSRRALGEEGLTRRDHERLGPLNTKIVQLDVTRVIQTGHMWNNYYIHPELAAAIEPYVYFDDVPAGFVPTADATSLDASVALANRSPERQKRRSLFPSFRSRSVKPTSAESVTSSSESER